MTVAVAIVVMIGLALVLVVALQSGIDAVGVVLIAVIACLGRLGVAVARRAGAAEPARCRACGGLISPRAPYCKHCGTRAD